MSHSDDTGLVLPPRVAPTQVVVVAIGDDPTVVDVVNTVTAQLVDSGVRATADTRTHLRPGRRYFEWERKGVPLRLEIGARDIASGSATAKPRPQAYARSAVPLHPDTLPVAVSALLDDVQDGLLEQATARLGARTVEVSKYADMLAALGSNDEAHTLDGAAFFLAPWAADDENEAAIQQECKATIRCYPDAHNPPAPGAECFYSGRPATHVALFARAF